MTWWQVGLIAVAAGGVLILLTRSPPIQATLRRWRQQRLLELFHSRREELRRDFLRHASASGKPRGLRWLAADWEPVEVLARDRTTGMYLLLAPVALRFEAESGGDMEDVPAVGLAKQATALFYFDGRTWQTRGKAVFNLDPDATLQRLAALYERIA
jgi:hypothetical protein